MAKNASFASAKTNPAEGICNNNHLLAAMKALETLCNDNNIRAVLYPEDYYFAERALIELGVITKARKMTAHKAFLRMMEEIGYRFPRKTVPSEKDLVLGASYITEAPYPWEPNRDTIEADDNETDLQRWRAIYRCIQRHLRE